MLCVNRAMGQFQKRLASITALKGGFVEHFYHNFSNITATIYCNYCAQYKFTYLLIISVYISYPSSVQLFDPH